MGLTGGERIAMTAGAALLAGGLAAGCYGVLRDDIPAALAAASAVFVGFGLVALVLFRTWIMDVRDQRCELAQARQEAEAERLKFFALQAAAESEMTRLHRDVNAQRAHITKMLAVEREALHAEFEERRLEEAKAAFLTGVEMERSGALKPEAPVPANLIQFPKQLQGTEAQREPAREHGVVGP